MIRQVGLPSVSNMDVYDFNTNLPIFVKLRSNIILYGDTQSPHFLMLCHQQSTWQLYKPVRWGQHYQQLL
jgi:hypothetical protein